MTKDIKKLTGAELKKQSKELDKQREFTVEIGGQDYKLTHDVVFRKTKQIKVIEDLIEFFSKGAEHPELLDKATPFTALIIIKHFTSLEVSDDIDDALILLGILIDLDALGKIINELPEDEVVEMFKIIEETIKNVSGKNEDNSLSEIEELKE